MDLFFEDIMTGITVDEREFEQATFIDHADGLMVKADHLDALIKIAADLSNQGHLDQLEDMRSIIKECAAKYKGKTVTLNKPFRTPDGPKKFSVYVKNDKGIVVKVNFGDPNMDIKRDDPKRRKNFRARHKCKNPGPKWKAKYWACKTWSKKPVSKIVK